MLLTSITLVMYSTTNELDGDFFTQCEIIRFDSRWSFLIHHGIRLTCGLSNEGGLPTWKRFPRSSRSLLPTRVNIGVRCDYNFCELKFVHIELCTNVTAHHLHKIIEFFISIWSNDLIQSHFENVSANASYCKECLCFWISWFLQRTFCGHWYSQIIHNPPFDRQWDLPKYSCWRSRHI